jgi:hypothetical protein
MTSINKQELSECEEVGADIAVFAGETIQKEIQRP